MSRLTTNHFVQAHGGMMPIFTGTLPRCGYGPPGTEAVIPILSISLGLKPSGLGGHLNAQKDFALVEKSQKEKAETQRDDGHHQRPVASQRLLDRAADK